MSDSDTLNALERQQRKAYWKGEETATRRLPQFLPQDPLSGAALKEVERMEAATEEMLDRVEAEVRWEQYVAEVKAANQARNEKAQHGAMMPLQTKQERLRSQDAGLTAVFGEDWQQYGDDVALPYLGKSVGADGHSPAGFSEDGQTYTTPATHIGYGAGPKTATNIPDDLVAEDAETPEEGERRQRRSRNRWLTEGMPRP